MSTQRGIRIECDRCGEQIFLKELEVEEKETDGGFTRWNKYKYEEKPKDWHRVYLGSGCCSYDLCQECYSMWSDMSREFWKPSKAEG